ncbi:MAG: hypothetical protein ACXWCX_07635 [Burkholderiales bacterium]
MAVTTRRTVISNLDPEGELMTADDPRVQYHLGKRNWHSDSSVTFFYGVVGHSPATVVRCSTRGCVVIAYGRGSTRRTSRCQLFVSESRRRSDAVHLLCHCT